MAISERKARVLRQREQDILQAAGDSFRRGDWHRTTIDEIAKNAGVGKGTVYLHFKSKEEIVERLALMGCKRLLGRIHGIPARGSPEDRVRGLIAAARHVLQDHPETLAWLATARSGRAGEGGGAPSGAELEAVRNAIVETTARIVSGAAPKASPAPGTPGDPEALAAAV
ncbi:MAG: TetR/AcrR family transcriptional regulator, partial [SAR324 cluster bacterium]|nr:TetR/AcrR family transcriptional regulator [SAR324 cluster bacterium]